MSPATTFDRDLKIESAKKSKPMHGYLAKYPVNTLPILKTNSGTHIQIGNLSTFLIENLYAFVLFRKTKYINLKKHTSINKAGCLTNKFAE
jgi:hypothetical protein